MDESASRFPRGRRRISSSGRLLLAVLIVAAAHTLSVAAAHASNTWAATGAPNVGRERHTATLLADGRVLVVGGLDAAGGALASVEAFNPSTGSFTPLPSISGGPRFSHVAVRLRDGRVLVAGGRNGAAWRADAWLFSPGTNSWASAGNMNVARADAEAVLLENDRVLITGGNQPSGVPIAAVEIFDPIGGFNASPAASLLIGREGHSMTRLADGRVVIVGGSTLSGITNTVEVYDPGTVPDGSFAFGPALSTARLAHVAVELADGRILVAGGNDGSGELATSELIARSLGSVAPGPALRRARAGARAQLLSSGDVLIVGGRSGPAPTIQSAEMLDPISGAFFDTNGMTVPRTAFTLTRLANGSLLAAGGGPGGPALGTAEIFSPESVRAYVPNSGSGTVTVLDATLTTNALITTLNVGVSPLGVAANLQGTRVYVANQSSGTLSVINAETLAVTASVPVQAGAFGVAVTPDGSKIYVTSPTATDLAVVTSANTVSMVPLGLGATGVAVSPDGTRLYVATSAGSDGLIEINTTSNAVVRNITLGSDPIGVAVSPDSTRVYVANRLSATISIVDVTGPSLTATTTAVPGQPFGVAVSPDGRWIYVAHAGTSTLSVLDAITGAPVTQPAVASSSSYGVAVRPDGRRVHVAHPATDNVSILDRASQPTFTGAVAVGDAPMALGQFVGVVASPAPSSADLSIAVVGNPSPVPSQTNIVYTITVTNNGPDPATAATVTTSMPQAGTFQGASTSQGTCSPPPVGSNTAVTCELGSLTVGQAATVTVVVRVVAPSGSVGTIVNTGASTPDPNTTNNSASVSTPITPTGSISGTVRQTDNVTPISGATVIILDGTSGLVVTTTTSAGNGTYSVPNLPPQGYKASAQAAGFVIEYFNNQTNLNAGTLINVTSGGNAVANFTLAGGAAAIRGRVTELDGITGIANAEVLIRTVDNVRVLSTTTGPDGSYDTGLSLGSGTYKVRASKAGYVTTYHASATNAVYATTVTVTAPTSQNAIDIAMSAVAGGISGRVTRAVSGVPLGGVGLAFVDATTGSTVFSGISTNGTGAYSSGLALAPGVYKVQTLLSGSASAFFSGRISAATGDPVTVVAGSITPNIDIEVALLSSITGQVTNASTGAAIVGASVQLRDFATNTTIATATTVDGGTFTFANLTPGTTFRLRASRGGFGTQFWNNKAFTGVADVVTVGTSAFVANFALSPNAGGISGRVVDAAAPTTGIASAFVNIYDGTTTNFSLDEFIFGTTADANGNFDTGQVLPAGIYKVVAGRVGSGYVQTFHVNGRDLSSATPVTVTASTTLPMTIALPLGATITGTVRDRVTNAPIAGTSVGAQRHIGGNFFGTTTTTTDANGVFTITGLDAGEWLVTAQAAGYVLGWYSGDPNFLGTDRGTTLPITLTATGTATNINFNLARGGATLQGRITRSDNGAPVRPGTSVNIRGPWPRFAITDFLLNATNGLGDYSVGSLPPGRWVVEGDRIQLPGEHAIGFHPFGSVSRASGVPIPLVDGQLVTVNFAVPALAAGETPRSITGTLRGPSGEVVRNVFVIAVEQNAGTAIRTVAAFHDGSYALDGLRPGRYLVAAVAENGYAAQVYQGEPTGASGQLIDVTLGDVTGIDFVFSDQHGSISGRVTRSDNGQAVMGASISVRNFFNDGILGVTGGTTLIDGTFHLRGLPPGLYRVRISAPGFRTVHYTTASTAGVTTAEAAPFITVAADVNTPNLDVVLVPTGGALAGTVRMQDTLQPVVATSIGVYEAAAGATVTFLLTDASGTFRTEGLAAGTYRLVAFDLHGARYAGQWLGNSNTLEGSATVTVEPGGTTAGADFLVSPVHGSISGMAFESDGSTPLRDVGVTLFDRVTGGVVLSGSVMITDAEGKYRLTGVAPGINAYVARAHALGRAFEFYDAAPSREAATTLTVTAGVETQDVDFAMHLSSEVTGNVTYLGSQPGALHVRLFLDAAMTRLAYSTIVTDPPVDGGSGGLLFSYGFRKNPAPDTRGVRAGTYFVSAFRDVNGNSVLDPTEPSGALVGSFTVADNQTFSPSNFAITDPPVNLNSAPVADAQTVPVIAAVPKTIVLTGQDVETATANLTYTIVTPPVNGVLTPTIDPQRYVYTANTGVTADAIAFTVTDRGTDACPVGCTNITSAPATVAVTVLPNTGTTNDAIFTSSMVAPLAGQPAGAAQLLGDLRIGENATGVLAPNVPIKIGLPPGLTFAAVPQVKLIVEAGATLGSGALEAGNTLFAFSLTTPSTSGKASIRISGMTVVLPPGYLDEEVSIASLTLSFSGGNPGLTTTPPVAVANVVPAGGAPSVSPHSISSLSIGQGAQNEIIVIQGTNFSDGITASVSGTGVDVVQVTKNSQTDLTLRLNATSAATEGFRNLTITNPSGLSVTIGQFLVTRPPKLESTNRDATNPLASNRQGQDISIRGTNFLPPTASPPDIGVIFDGSDITVTSINYIDPEEISVVVNVADGAAFGTRGLTVINPNGGFTTLAGAVTIGSEAVGNAPPRNSTTAVAPTGPVIAALTPNRARIGAIVTITGSGFGSNPIVRFVRSTGALVTATLQSASPTSLTAVVPVGAADGPVTVKAGTVVSGPVPFIVATPTLAGVTPAGALVNSQTAMTVAGSKFVSGAIVTFSGLGVTAGATTVAADGATLQTNVTVAANAAIGMRDVTVTNPDGGTATKTAIFEVRPAVTAALDLRVVGMPAAAYLPSVQSVSVTLDATGKCTAKTIVPTPVQVEAVFSTTTGAVAPAQVTFALESSALPGTATNEDCEIDPANPVKDFHVVGPAGTAVQNLAVAGGGLYPVVLHSTDMGGTVTITATAVLADGQVITGRLKLPVDTDNDKLPDAYETAAAFNADRNGVNVLNAFNSDQNANTVVDGDDRFARDGLSNFEKYRGIFVVGPAPGQTGVMGGFERLGAGRRHLFVRGRGFADDPAIPAGFCGINTTTEAPVADTRRCPAFQVGLAFERVGVRVHNVSASFAVGRQLPRFSMRTPTQAILDMATVNYNGSGCSGGESCDKIAKAGVRQWNFRTLAQSNYGSAAAYGASVNLYKRALDSYQFARPYEHRTNDPFAVLTAPDGTPMLAPLDRVGDSSSTGADNGIVDATEKTFGGQLTGDTYIQGAFDRQLSPLDVNSDGCVELPTVTDPTTLPRCDPNADSAAAPQATKQQLVRFLITHELGHNVGVNLHTTVATCVMYQYSINWTRDEFSPQAADLIQIHNKGGVQ